MLHAACHISVWQQCNFTFAPFVEFCNFPKSFAAKFCFLNKFTFIIAFENLLCLAISNEHCATFSVFPETTLCQHEERIAMLGKLYFIIKKWRTHIMTSIFVKLFKETNEKSFKKYCQHNYFVPASVIAHNFSRQWPLSMFVDGDGGNVQWNYVQWQTGSSTK